jgi:hypothetical protein
MKILMLLGLSQLLTRQQQRQTPETDAETDLLTGEDDRITLPRSVTQLALPPPPGGGVAGVLPGPEPQLALPPPAVGLTPSGPATVGFSPSADIIGEAVGRTGVPLRTGAVGTGIGVTRIQDQPDPTVVKPLTISMITSSDVQPIQRVDIPDLEVPSPPPQDPLIEGQQFELTQLKQAREDIKREPASYTRGKLRQDAQDALLRLDDEIAELSNTLGVNFQPTAEPLVTQRTGEVNLTRLTPGERVQRARLIEKIDDGKTLTDRETTLLDNIEGKITGDPIELLTATDEEKVQLLRDMEEATDREAQKAQREKVVRRRTRDAIKASKDIQDIEDSRAATGAPQRQGQLNTEEAREAIAPRRLLGEGLVVLARSTADIRDPRAQKVIEDHDARGGDPVQALHIANNNGSTYTLILLDRIPTAERLAAIYSHEVLVHHGLRTLPKDIRTGIVGLVKRHRGAEMELIARRRKQQLTKENEMEFAEEVLAEAAEKNDFELSFWRRVVAFIRKWVHRLLPERISLSENDVCRKRRPGCRRSQRSRIWATR